MSNKKVRGYPFTQNIPAPVDLIAEEMAHTVKDSVKRSQRIVCNECPKRCSTFKLVNYEEKKALLTDKEKLKELLNCDPPPPTQYPSPTQPPRYSVFTQKK